MGKKTVMINVRDFYLFSDKMHPTLRTDIIAVDELCLLRKNETWFLTWVVGCPSYGCTYSLNEPHSKVLSSRSLGYTSLPIITSRAYGVNVFNLPSLELRSLDLHALDLLPTTIYYC